MIESTLTQLKIIVERAVRPVQACSACKRRLREELLGQVSSAFNDEARLGDERAALQRTEQRFANAAKLTKQLQESIPAKDRQHRFTEAMVYPLGSPLYCGARNVLVYLAFSLIVVLLPALLICYLLNLFMGLNDWPRYDLVPFVVTVVLGHLVIGFVLFSLTFLAHWLRQALYGPAGRSWLKAFLVGAVSWLLIPSVAFGCCYGFSGDVWASFADVLLIFPLYVSTPLLLVAFAHLTAAEDHYQQEWASLQIMPPGPLSDGELA